MLVFDCQYILLPCYKFWRIIFQISLLFHFNISC